MKKIKVMHFVSGLVSGGVEQMLCNYCEELSNSENYEFIVVYQHEAVNSCKEKIEDAGCRVKRITARSESFIKNIVESYLIIKEENPDVVHAHMNLMNFCALYAAKCAGIKIRISHSHIAEKNKNLGFKIMALLCKKLCICSATMLLACGKEAGEYLYGEKRMKSGRVKVVENAIDIRKYSIDREEKLRIRKNKDCNNEFIVGHVGRFSYQKNHERLVAIFYELKKIKPNAKLLLIGTGELENQVRQQVKRYGIEKSVIFAGTTKTMRDMYALMDVFVLPSRYEGFPVVSVEIQAAQIPSLFSDTIAQTCRLTDYIDFYSLNESDEKWAKKILECVEKERCSDLENLYSKYDIKEKAKSLDKIYKRSLDL